MRRAITSMTAMALLAGCSGGGGTTPTPPTPSAVETEPSAAPSTTEPSASETTGAPSESSSPSESDPNAELRQYEGIYAGGWENTTYGSSGDVSLDIDIDFDAQTITVTGDASGRVLGQDDPPPQTATASLLEAREGVALDSDLYGPILFMVTHSYEITISGDDVPGSVESFEAHGTITPDEITGVFTVTFEDGSPDAEGTFLLTRGS